MRGYSLKSLQSSSRCIWFNHTPSPAIGGNQRRNEGESLEPEQNSMNRKKTKKSDGNGTVSIILAVYSRAIDSGKLI